MNIFYIADHRFILAAPIGSADQFFIRINKDFSIIIIIIQGELCVTDMVAYISLQMNLDDDLGIAIAGGIDTPAIPNDSSIVITNVAKGSIADGKLR